MIKPLHLSIRTHIALLSEVERTDWALAQLVTPDGFVNHKSQYDEWFDWKKNRYDQRLHRSW